VTTLSAEGPFMVGGKKVAAGKYSVYVHAAEGGAWDLVLNSDQGVPLGKIWDKAPDNMKNEPWPHLEGYKNIEATEVARAKMTAAKAAPTDLFTITLAPKGKGADLTLAWGAQAWSVALEPAK
jgi:hypothetical protein